MYNMPGALGLVAKITKEGQSQVRFPAAKTTLWTNSPPTRIGVEHQRTVPTTIGYI